MHRRNFITLTGATVVVAGGLYYLFTDKRNAVRTEPQNDSPKTTLLTTDERTILYLASLAPSGHNTQPWLVKHIEPYHWIIGNDKSKWLNAVDPTQRETVLSLGAFLQNLEYAAGSLGYACQIAVLATSNQDEDVAEITLTKSGSALPYNTQNITHRRTIRSNYLNDVLAKEDVAYLIANETDFIQYVPNTAKAHQWLNRQTLEANRIQAYRDDAEQELANWIRFSSKDAYANNDGLTLATMEIGGVAAWYLRNFYGKADVMKNSFRDKSIETVTKQLAESAGWLLITSKDNSVVSLLETGKRLQRLLLKIRARNIAVHPMTQILEEPSILQTLHAGIQAGENLQFILRTGYVKHYPDPVSLRRSVDLFTHTYTPQRVST